ncbi:hypothetical protein A0H81_03529 [Grifola frondosa]|uniref:Uncharacterized protein n=1 Tax=Grifola frondosa TaxID=5627 RepID=A0A1C7ML27_GRIFR|nr:hypothetical protein A0H81_03529 [Grifola frondosa]
MWEPSYVAVGRRVSAAWSEVLDHLARSSEEGAKTKRTRTYAQSHHLAGGVYENKIPRRSEEPGAVFFECGPKTPSWWERACGVRPPSSA